MIQHRNRGRQAIMSIVRLVGWLALLLAAGLTTALAAGVEQDPAWKANAEARARFFEETVGPLPASMQKMVTMTGVWPDGGFYVIPATKLDPKSSLSTTFGLSNTDMPARTRLVEANNAAPGETHAVEAPTVEAKAEVAGYGYELAVLADSDAKWPLGFLQWAADAEIVNNVGLLKQVQAEGNLVIENVRVGTARPLHVLVAAARPPLPAGTDLPAGRMSLLIATAITADELRWSRANGGTALLDKLGEAGVGQHSDLDRASVVR